MTCKSFTNTGFSLVEVLIASLMIMLGVTGYVTLQSEFVKADSHINLRNIALQLAQEKLDDLASFSQIESQANQFSYNDIGSNVGGQLSSGSVDVVLGNNQSNVRTFNRSWQVKNKYFIDTDNDLQGDTWVDSNHPNLLPPIPRVAGQKSISIQLDWVDYQGGKQSLILNGTLTPVPQSRSLLAISELASAEQSPVVTFSSSTLPDTHDAPLGKSEFKQSASPQIVDGERVDMTFEQHRNVNGLEVKTSVSDFATIACRCELVGMGQGMTPSMTILDGEKLAIQTGKFQQKMTGKSVANGQSALCHQCCQDHHDSSQTIADEEFYRAEVGLPHEHFKRLENMHFQQASAPGDQYDEVCRFRRVDGYYVLYPDWQLIELLVLSPGYLLNAANQTSYSDYVKALLLSHINDTAQPKQPAGRDVDTSLAGRQLTARGLYLDRLKASDKAKLQALISNGESDWLRLTPFYDINLTLLAEWSTLDSAVAIVSNEPIAPFSAKNVQYYDVYSRGKLTFFGAGQTTISASAFMYNSTLAGQPPISPAELAALKQDNSVSLK